MVGRVRRVERCFESGKVGCGNGKSNFFGNIFFFEKGYEFFMRGERIEEKEEK